MIDQHKESPTSEQMHEASSAAVAPGEIVIGTLIDIDSAGQLLVVYPGCDIEQPLIAISTVSINQTHKGRQVALLFVNADLEKPVIMGLIHSPLFELLEQFEYVVESEVESETTASSDEDKLKSLLPVAKLDGQRVVLEGKEEIVLKCGDASITLTKEGKILIRGKYLLNRSSGVNRIMGGSVQVN